MIAAGNSVVFNAHRRKNVCNIAVQIINDAIGVPTAGELVDLTAEPTIESAQAVMTHQNSTADCHRRSRRCESGDGVKARRSTTGGPGNPPIVDETAD